MPNTKTFTRNFGLAKPAFDVTTWHDDVNGNADKIDALLSLVQPPIIVDGTWANSTVYTIGKREIDDDLNLVFMCLVDHTSASSGSFATDRVAHPTYWVEVFSGFAWRSTWTTGTVYRVGDLVFNSGSTYIARTDHTSGTFATDLAAIKWELFAQAGAPGPGSGDVNGPASAVDARIAVFDGITGKIIKDGGTLLSALATLLSPSLTGVPTGPTAAPGTSTTQLATTAFVAAVATALVAGSPITTLDALSAAINDDPAFSATINAALALLAPKASPAFSGNPTATTQAITDESTRLATTAYVASRTSKVLATQAMNTLKAKDFTGFPTTIKHISVSMDQVSTNGTNTKLIQIGTGGVIDVVGYRGGAGYVLGAGATLISPFTDGVYIYSTLAADLLSGIMQMDLVDETNNIWAFSGLFHGQNAQMFITAMSKALAGELNILRVTSFGSADTFDGGTVGVSYW